MMFDAQCTVCSVKTPTPLHYEGISIKCSSCGEKFVAIDPKERLFKFHCSSCGGKIQAKEKYRGTLAPCPHCEKVVPVGDYNMDTRPLSEPEPAPAPAQPDSPTPSTQGVIDRSSRSSSSKLIKSIGKMFGR